MKKDALKTPFFASLLETQQFYPGPNDPTPTSKEYDSPYQTHKYPSDHEDNPGGPKDPGKE